MSSRCYSWQAGSHASTLTPCTFCDEPAVFHWRNTYPELLLCRSCLDAYPEALGAKENEHIEIEWMNASVSAT